MKKKTLNKKRKYQNADVADISKMFDRINTIDASLRSKLSVEGYTKLNQIISDNVRKAYYERMKPVTSTLMQNRELVDQKPNFSNSLKTINDYWRKDPNKLTNEQLIEEIIKISELLNKQKSDNQNLKGEVEIIRLASQQMEMERKNLYLTLKEMELSSAE